MAGILRKLKNNKWELCVHIGYDLSGKRIRKYKYIETTKKGEAEKLLAEFVAECKRSDYNDAERMTLKEYSSLWFRDYVEKNLKKKTISDYKDMLERILLCLGHKKIGDIKPTHLIEFYNILGSDGSRKDGKPGGLSPKTIKHYHLVISSMLGIAYQWGLIKENVCKRVTPPKVPKNMHQIISIEEAKELLEALNKESFKNRLLVMLAIFTGFRRGEIMGLEWSDIDFENNTITINRTSSYTSDYGIFEDTTKNEYSYRTTYVPILITKMLKKHYANWTILKDKFDESWNDTNRLFVQKNGAPMSPDTISKWFPQFIRKYNLRQTRFHDLRHAHGSILLALGMDPASVADQLGHSSLEMLNRVYGHNVRKNSKEVAEFMEKALLDLNEN